MSEEAQVVSESVNPESSGAPESAPEPQSEGQERHPLGSADPVTSRQEKVVAKPEVGKKFVDPKKSLLAQDSPVETPAYVPNTKVKVMDKEHDIPEWARSGMKDVESEKAIREVFEKAHGLDAVKPKLAQEREAHGRTREQLSGVQATIGELREEYQRGNLEQFFKKMNVDENKVLQYFLDKINYQELPPEQKQAQDARRTAEERAFELEKNNRHLNSKFQEQVNLAKGIQLETALARAEVQSIASEFDSRPGKTAGAFRDEVIARGELAWYRSKVDLTPDQAVKEVLDIYGLSARAQSSAPTPVAAQPQAIQPAPAAPPKTQVIPNVGGRASSPMKSKPKSIADLKKLAASMP